MSYYFKSDIRGIVAKIIYILVSYVGARFNKYYLQVILKVLLIIFLVILAFKKYVIKNIRAKIEIEEPSSVFTLGLTFLLLI